MHTVPLSLYIHFPWCVKKCPYCDFNSHTLKQDLPESQYIDALIADLQENLPLVWGRTVHSIFLGGGTPSLFSPQAIETLLNRIRSLLNFSPEIEITLEANPGTTDESHFDGFKQAGINRLSIGVQSFNPTHLTKLGRIHTDQDAKHAMESAKKANIKNINIDLMHGLPQQTLENAIDDLNVALALSPQHISWYQLTLEPNTLFYHQPPMLPADDMLWDIFTEGGQLLTQSGYEFYEVSNFALPKHQCQHNLNYWEFGDYLGIGAGAHSKLTDFTTQQITRIAKKRHPKDYLSENTRFTDETRHLTAADCILEFMMNALRLKEGFHLDLFESRTFLRREVIEQQLRKAAELELVTVSNKQVRPTAKGFQYLNDLLHCFM